MADSVLTIVHELFRLLVITNPVGHILLLPHFADEETGARVPAQACEQQSSQELLKFQISEAVSLFGMIETRSQGEPSQLLSCQHLSQTAVIPEGTKPRLRDPSHALLWGLHVPLRFLNETACRQLG